MRTDVRRRRAQSSAPAASDAETKARLLTAATSLFAAQGFKDVTVRDICRSARANVAAINYHYGDKAGLYREVIRTAIVLMQETTAIAREWGRDKKAEEKLRIYVRTFLERVSDTTHAPWIHQLMTWEMADPTNALDLVFNEVLRPRFAYLSEIIGAILDRPQDDPVVRRSVLSVLAQCHTAMRNRLSEHLVPALADPAELDLLIDHIADFSLGGLRAVRKR